MRGKSQFGDALMPHHTLAAEKRGTCHGLNLFVCAIFARNPGFDNLQTNIAVGRQSHQDAAPAFERGPYGARTADPGGAV